jgi:outer membrane lipase/esterase
MKNNASTTPLRCTAAFAAITVSLAASSGVRAQTTPLPTLPGYTEVQQNMANAIDVVCPRLGPAGISPDQNGTAAQRLAFNCTAMVVTSAVLQGKPVNPQTAARFNLGIGNDQLRDLVQASGPVQHGAQNQMTVTASSQNLLAARLFDLRTGVRGMSISVNGVDVPSADATTLASSARGGGASPDTQFGGRLSGFVKVAGNWGKVDQTSLQDAYKYDAWSILAGADYRVTDALVAGGALSYEDTRSRFDNSLGHVDAATWSAAGYATYTSGPWYVDGYISYGHVDYDTTRTILVPSNNPQVPTIVSNANASPRGNQWSLSAGTGYNIPMANYLLVPFARLGYIDVKNKAFSESESGTGLGLAVGDRTLESLQTAIGATISTTVNTTHGVFGPYFTAQWVHEFKNDNPSIVAKFVNDPNNFQFFIPTERPTRDYGVFIVGSSATLPNGFSGFLQLGAAAGLRDATNYNVVLGLRKEL